MEKHFFLFIFYVLYQKKCFVNEGCWAYETSIALGCDQEVRQMAVPQNHHSDYYTCYDHGNFSVILEK